MQEMRFDPMHFDLLKATHIIHMKPIAIIAALQHVLLTMFLQLLCKQCDTHVAQPLLMWMQIPPKYN